MGRRLLVTITPRDAPLDPAMCSRCETQRHTRFEDANPVCTQYSSGRSGSIIEKSLATARK
jgi:hypothetical protein